MVDISLFLVGKAKLGSLWVTKLALRAHKSAFEFCVLIT